MVSVPVETPPMAALKSSEMPLEVGHEPAAEKTPLTVVVAYALWTPLFNMT